MRLPAHLTARAVDGVAVSSGGSTDYRAHLTAVREDALGPLSNSLWEIRELLDMVCYLLTVERLLATSGEVSYLHYAAQQLDVATEQVRRTEIIRSAHSEAAAIQLGLGPGATLAELAVAAPAPWDEILAEHRDALRTASDRVNALRAGTDAALRAGAEAVQTTLRAVEDQSRLAAPGPARLDYRA